MLTDQSDVIFVSDLVWEGLNELNVPAECFLRNTVMVPEVEPEPVLVEGIREPF